MQQKMEKDTHGAVVIIRLIAAMCAVLAILCFAAPAVRQSGALRSVGERTIVEMSAAAIAISYYSSDTIAQLSETPAETAEYKRLAGLLSQYNAQFGYQKSYLLLRNNDKSLKYLVDGSYRDNAAAGTEYYLPGEDYPLNGAYKPVKSILDKIYSGKSTAGYAGELITRVDLRKVAVVCLPVYGVGHTVTAVLCVEIDPGDTAYHMVGTVNLYNAGLILTAIFLCCLIMLTLRKKYRRYRQMKLEEQQAEQQEQQTQQAQPETDSKPAAESDEAQPPYDDGEQPDDRIDTLQ